jgi:hypothetical protein
MSKHAKTTTSVSEESSVRRGRPRVLDTETEDFMRKLIPHGRDMSRRTIMNEHYHYAAVNALREYPDLVDGFSLRSLSPRTSTVLAEIGRLGDPVAMVVAARWHLQTRLPAREAASVIRRHRCKSRGLKQRGGSLKTELARVVDSFRLRYPDTTYTDVLTELSLVAESVQQVADREADHA